MDVKWLFSKLPEAQIKNKCQFTNQNPWYNAINVQYELAICECIRKKTELRNTCLGYHPVCVKCLRVSLNEFKMSKTCISIISCSSVRCVQSMDSCLKDPSIPNRSSCVLGFPGRLDSSALIFSCSWNQSL